LENKTTNHTINKSYSTQITEDSTLKLVYLITFTKEQGE